MPSLSSVCPAASLYLGNQSLTRDASLGSFLAAVFLRGVGIVGHGPNPNAKPPAQDVENQAIGFHSQGSAQTAVGDVERPQQAVEEKQGRVKVYEEARFDDGDLQEAEAQS